VEEEEEEQEDSEEEEELMENLRKRRRRSLGEGVATSSYKLHFRQKQTLYMKML
jgi:hypothetical protein